MASSRGASSGVLGALARRLHLLIAGLAVVAVAAGTAVLGGPVMSRNAVLGQSLASHLLSLPVLPQSARRVAEPTSRMLAVPPEKPASQDLVDLSSYWVVPMPMSTFTAYLAGHAPVGLRPSVGSWSGSETSSGFAEPQPPAYAQLAQVVYSYAPWGRGSTQLRVDAQVIWRPTRSAAFMVPSNDRSATISLTGRISRRVVITEPAIVDQLRQMVDTLPTEAPPETVHCALSPGTTSLRFATSPGGRSALSVTEVIGCDQFSVSSAAGHLLLEQGGLLALELRLLGVTGAQLYSTSSAGS